jgi:hypothetical protein
MFNVLLVPHFLLKGSSDHDLALYQVHSFKVSRHAWLYLRNNAIRLDIHKMPYVALHLHKIFERSLQITISRQCMCLLIIDYYDLIMKKTCTEINVLLAYKIIQKLDFAVPSLFQMESQC